MTNKGHKKIQIKVCGLTRVEEALGCAELGVDAVGCVFFPKSPRHLSDDQAREICLALPDRVTAVGVFVNESFYNIMQRVERCGLNAVQLHGRESPGLVNHLRRANLPVIKALFAAGEPSLKEVSKYQASAYLVECGQGRLPGGNALAWNWGEAKGLGVDHPLILAGGLSPENVCEAIAAGLPDAVDVSSGVESAPGRKDLSKVEAFIKAIKPARDSKTFRKIF
jgi:phosphoribosylanthranilate isomerase